MIEQINELMTGAGAERMILSLQRDAHGNLTVVANTVLGAAPAGEEAAELRKALAMPLVVRGEASEVASTFGQQLSQYATTMQPVMERYSSLGKAEKKAEEATQAADKAKSKKAGKKAEKPDAAKTAQAAQNDQPAEEKPQATEPQETNAFDLDDPDAL